MATNFPKSAPSASAMFHGSRAQAVRGNSSASYNLGGLIGDMLLGVEREELEESDEGMSLCPEDAEQFAKRDHYGIHGPSLSCNLLADAGGCERMTIVEDCERKTIGKTNFELDGVRSTSSAISRLGTLGFEENDDRTPSPRSTNVTVNQDYRIDALLGPPLPLAGSIAEFWIQLRELEALIPPAHSLEDPRDVWEAWNRVGEAEALMQSARAFKDQTDDMGNRVTTDDDFLQAFHFGRLPIE